MKFGHVKEISVFADESGSYDSDVSSSRYYMICLVFHDQDSDITADIRKLEEAITRVGKPANHCVHTSPLIRRENEYLNDLREVRKQIFFKTLTFARKADINYKCFFVDKQFVDGDQSIHDKLHRDLSEFLISHDALFACYDRIKIYYDNGQAQIKKVLEESFEVFSGRTEFVPEVTPIKYRLFQVADLICTLELMRLRIEEGVGLNNSEKAFFGNARLFKRNVLSQLVGKEVK